MQQREHPIFSTGIKIRYFDADAWGQEEIHIPIDMSVVMERGPHEEEENEPGGDDGEAPG